ncbi:hypothetical protein [Streptomyces sp. NPDC048659]|uniref:DUF7144 family membrane protein n=1 Tax=Streptomyces sp. NPDC048659 TaxID=3155489 RepID=UPI003418D0A0
MSQQTTPPPGAPRHGRDTDGWVAGGVVFAAVLMLCGGVLAILQGISAVAENDVYTRIGSYVYELSLTSWGWIHIVLGALVALTGAGLLKGATWARFTGLLLVTLSLLAQFLFLPYAPFWSILMMAIDVFVIWALAGSLDTPARGGRNGARTGGR